MSLIYIVEDDENIREIESFALKNSGHDILEFGNAKELYKILSDKVPDLILLDVMLPDEDGLQIVKKLRSMPQTKKVPILMVTAKTSVIDKVKGLDIGADDYLTKPFGIMELISRVKALIRRSNNEMNEEKLLTSGDIIIEGEKHAVYVKGESCELTYKEYELLKLLVLNKGIVIPRDVILERIWGIDFEGESRTLDMHIKTLRHKLKEAGGEIKTVRGVGYMIQ